MTHDHEPKPEHGHFILYVFGALSLALGSWKAAGALQEGLWSGAGAWPLGLGVAAITVGAFLHDRDQRRRHQPAAEDRGTDGNRWLHLGIGLFLSPMIGAWVQFERFQDPIQMFPFTTIVGGVISSYGLARFLLPAGRSRRVLGPTLAASIGVPGALLAHALLVGHFTHHLSNVAVWALPGDQISGDPTLVGADLPLMEHDLELPSTQLELMAALDATPVDPSAFRIGADGTMLRINADGTETPVETLAVGELDAMFDEAKREDEVAARKARERRRAAYDAELESLRQGGRFFR